jgi:prophage DNA circulation protein
MAIYEQYPVASWKVGGRAAIAFSIGDITETGGNRIIAHERPYRDGAKLDDTGSKPRKWSFQALFNNTIEEDGITTVVAPYPGVLRLVLRSFDFHETGDLTLPTIGTVRARAEDYSRKETRENQDTGTLDLVFAEDNEEALDRAQLNPPSVMATLVRLAEQTVFSAPKNGAWHADLSTLRERCNEITTLLAAPGRTVADIGAVSRAHRRAIASVFESLTTLAKQTNGLFAGGRGAENHRQAKQLLDREAQAESERTSTRPATRAYVVDVEECSLWDVAARVDQAIDDLLELNAARIDDPFLLTRGQVLRVYESAPR